VIDLIATGEPINVECLEWFISHLFNNCLSFSCFRRFFVYYCAQLWRGKTESLVQIKVSVLLKFFFLHLFEDCLDVSLLHWLNPFDGLINKDWKWVMETIPWKRNHSSRCQTEVKSGALCTVNEFSEVLIQTCLPHIREGASQRCTPEITFCSVNQ